MMIEKVQYANKIINKNEATYQKYIDAKYGFCCDGFIVIGMDKDEYNTIARKCINSPVISLANA